MAQISLVDKVHLERTHRLDAEHYKPLFTQAAALLRLREPHALTDLCHISDGNHAAVSKWFTDEGIRYLRGQDLNDFFIGDANPIYIPREIYDTKPFQRSHFKPLDILLSIVGTVGSVAMVPPDSPPLTGNCKIAIVRAKKIDPFLLAIFLSCRYGQLQISQHTRGAVQTGLLLEDFDQIIVPTVTAAVQDKVEALVSESYRSKQRTADLYAQAQQAVLDEAGFSRLDLTQSPFYSVALSEANAVGRIDAEHFQPKYERLIDSLRKTGRAKMLGELVTEPIRRGAQPEYIAGGEVLVINSQHLGAQVLNMEATERTDRDSWARDTRSQLSKNDVLIYATGAYVGRTNVFPEDVKAVASNHVTIVRLAAECDPFYGAVFLNSPLGIMQADRWATGSAQRELYSAAISRFVIALPDRKFQSDVADMVMRAYDARQKAKALIEEATRLVEDFIESAH